MRSCWALAVCIMGVGLSPMWVAADSHMDSEIIISSSDHMKDHSAHKDSMEHVIVDDHDDKSDDDKHDGSSLKTTHSPMSMPKSTWVFGTYHLTNYPHTFLDDNGRLVGHDFEMMADVCQIAGKKCRIAAIPFSQCLGSTNGVFAAGNGLMTKYFDGCLGIWNVPYRESIVDFSAAYRPALKTFFWKRKGDTQFDPTNISGKTIVEVRTWSSRLTCLSKHISSFKGKSVLSSHDAINMVLNGTADAFFSTFEPALQEKLEQSGPGLICSSGTSIMGRMSSPVIQYWSKAFKKYVACGCYMKRCRKSEMKYGVAPRCFMHKPSGGCSHGEMMRYCP